MKISQIVINNYRAFFNPKGEELTKHKIDLCPGKNLLIYGENGSGKSSLFRGLKDLFASSVNPDCKVIPNIFSRSLNLDVAPFIEVTFTGNEDNPVFRFSDDEHETNTGDPLLRSVAISRSFMTYRDLLRVHFVNSPEVNLFDFLFEKDGLLTGLPNPVSTRSETSIKMGELLALVKARPDEVNIQDFVNGVNQILSEINTSLNMLLRYFDQSMEVTFSELTVVATTANVPVIRTEIKYFGIPLSTEPEKYQDFLNEARLSALAICIFLAAHLSVPRAPYEILFLDDIFTGLDTSNRIPLLKIFTDDIIEGTFSDTFTDHQLILTTYDRQWYELAKNYLKASTWCYQELYIDRHSTGFDQPAFLPGKNDQERALYYFRMHQYPACANYQRKICEQLIKKFLPKARKYDALPNGEIKATDKLNTLVDRFDKYLEEYAFKTSEFDDMKICIRAFMNPLSHNDDDIPVFRKELELGFQLIEKLKMLSNTEVLKEGSVISTTQADTESGVKFKYEFENIVSVRLISTGAEKRLSKIHVRPLRMTNLTDGKIQHLGYEPEPLEKTLKSLTGRLKMTTVLDPMKDVIYKNGANEEALETLLT